jgi:hypothetical protein
MRSESPVRREMYWLMLALATTMATVHAFESPETQKQEADAARAKKLTAEALSNQSASPKSSPEKQTPDSEKSATVKSSKKPTPPKKLFKGQVVFVRTALKKRGIQVAPEMKEQAVLETADGELIPIAADWRGRAFYQDKRLRDRKVELVGYRQKGIPYLQVLGIYMIDKSGKREEMDYWCDICSIPMYEIKDCECCQGEIRLRFRESKLPDYVIKSKTTPSKSKPQTKSKSQP